MNDPATEIELLSPDAKPIMEALRQIWIDKPTAEDAGGLLANAATDGLAAETPADAWAALSGIDWRRWGIRDVFTLRAAFIERYIDYLAAVGLW